MTTPREFADLIVASATEGGVTERIDLLIFTSDLIRSEIRDRWLELRADPPEFTSAITITDANSDASLEAGAAISPGEQFRITVQKRSIAHQLRIFLAATLGTCSEALLDVDNVLVATMLPHETFTTHRSRFQLWTKDAVDPFSPSETLPDPRGFVSDFTGKGEVSSDARVWLLGTPPEAPGDAFRIWRLMASRRLMAILADRVSSDATNTVNYHFGGPPACTFTLTGPQNDELSDRLQTCAKWVFNNARDVDTRHLLMAAEWARTYRKGELSHLGEGSLESAIAAFNAYVKSGSKETLKALSELRKAVVDEGQKAAQRAQDLAGAMWKDMAIAAAPFLLKILPDAAKTANQMLSGVLALCAAAFLLFSISIQVFINHRFFKNQDKARRVWKDALHFALSRKEVDDLSELPIQQGVNDYRVVRSCVGAVYGILFITLVAYGWTTLGATSAPDLPKQKPPVASPNISNGSAVPSPGTKLSVQPSNTPAQAKTHSAGKPP